MAIVFVATFDEAVVYNHFLHYESLFFLFFMRVREKLLFYFQIAQKIVYWFYIRSYDLPNGWKEKNFPIYIQYAIKLARTL